MVNVLVRVCSGRSPADGEVDSSTKTDERGNESPQRSAACDAGESTNGVFVSCQ